MRTKTVIECLNQQDGQNRNIQTIHLKDLTCEVQSIPYDNRQTTLEKQYNFGSKMLTGMITGEQPGQIMVNIDEFKAETEDTGDAEQIAKEWKHLYQPDCNLLFNPIIFPQETLTGHKIGDFMIAKYKLFDHSLKPSQVDIMSKS